MPLIVWDESYSVKIDEIDQQHKKLVHIINLLHEVVNGKTEQTDPEDILDDLIEYIAIHFRTEEKYLEKLDEEDQVNHLKQHEKFMKQILDFYSDYRKGKISLNAEMMEFLNGWLNNHIKGSDRDYMEQVPDSRPQ